MVSLFLFLNLWRRARIWISAGTENLPGIVAMSEAMHKQHIRREEHYSYLSSLKKYFIDELMEIPGCLLNSPAGDSEFALPHIINFSIPGIPSIELLQAFGKGRDLRFQKFSCSSKPTNLPVFY